MDDEDDFFAELCGVSVSDMGTAADDERVVLQDVCLAVERAVIETRAVDIDAALARVPSALAGQTQRLRAALVLGKRVCDGSYAEIVRSEIGQHVVHEALLAACPSELDSDNKNDHHFAMRIAKRLEVFVAQSARGQADDVNEFSQSAASYEILFVAIAFFNLFVQANYTGPAIDPETIKDLTAIASQALGLAADEDAKTVHREAVLTLQVDGESPFTICEFPSFLAVGRAMLSFVGNAKHSNWSVAVQQIGASNNNNDDDDNDETEDAAATPVVANEIVSVLQNVHTASWWNARAAVAHERLLIAKDPSNTLWYEARRGFVHTLRDATLFSGSEHGAYLRTRALVEWGLAQNFFDKNKQGKRTFARAQETSGLTAELSGSMGKRTKYQQKSVAQMVLLAASKYPPPQEGETDAVYANAMAEATHADFGGRKVGANEEETAPATVPDGELTEDELRIQKLVEDGEAAYRNVHLDQVDPDNILLEQIQFEDATLTAQGNLQPIDQVVLLSLCLDVKNSNAGDGLTREEMFPYVTRVLENPNNWMVYSTGLLERAWIECESDKRRERAVLQMQALVDQHTTRLTVLQHSLQAIEDAAPVSERMQFIHALAFPPRYALKRDLAERYSKLGVMRSALEIFLELEMWDDVVLCYQVLDQPTKAEQVVRARLAIAPTPYMWTCLGDLTQDITHYETAWELSKHRFARAKRSLGRHYFEKGEYETAIAHYLASVEVSPMHNVAWFVLGTMSMRTQNWALGLRALTRVVQLEPDNGEAWGNIGSIHLTNGRYAEAFSVLGEALKQKREMWQMWENYAFCAIQIERYGEAMYALHQWLDLRHKHKRTIDHELLAWLVEAIVFPNELKKVDTSTEEKEEVGSVMQAAMALAQHQQQLDDDEEEEDLTTLDEAAVATDATPPQSHANYKKQLALLFGRLASITTSNPKVWQVYARFNDGVGRKEKALDCRLKQCRALQAAGWETEQARVDELCRAAVGLAKDYIADGSKKALYACRLYIRGVLKKAQVDFGALESVQHLAQTLAQVEELEQQL